MFPGGPPSKYYPGPTMLNFRDLTRSGVFIVVWTCHDRVSFLRVFKPCCLASARHSKVQQIFSGFVPRTACFGYGTAYYRNCPPPDELCGHDPSRATLEERRTSRPISSKVLGGSLGARLEGTSKWAENCFSGDFHGPGGLDTGPPGLEPVGPEVWSTFHPNRTLRKAFGLRACPCNSEVKNSKTALSRALLAVFRDSRKARRGWVRRGHTFALHLDRSEP